MELALSLTNQAQTAALVFRLVNQCGTPVFGLSARIFALRPMGSRFGPLPDSERLPGRGWSGFLMSAGGVRYQIQLPYQSTIIIEPPAHLEVSGTGKQK